MIRSTLLAVTVLGLAVGVVAVRAADEKAEHKHDHDHDHAKMLPKFGVCLLRPTKDSKVRGALRFTQHEGYVEIKGQVTNLTPGAHGFHIHEFGDLRGNDGKAAGGHFNPEGHMHGGPGDSKRHVGDLGNIEAGADGVAKVDVKVPGAQLHFIVGRSIVVHADADDLKSQPSGNAGPRVAVGVIGIASAAMLKKN